MYLDNRLVDGSSIRVRTKNPAMVAFQKLHVMDDDYSEMIDNLYESSRYQATSWWEEVGDDLNACYDDRAFIPLGTLGTGERLKLAITHSQFPIHTPGHYDRELNLALAPWNRRDNSRSYIMILFENRTLPVYLVKDVNASRKTLDVVASYEGETSATRLDNHFTLKQARNLIDFPCMQRYYWESDYYQELETPYVVKFGRESGRRRRRGRAW